MITKELEIWHLENVKKYTERAAEQSMEYVRDFFLSQLAKIEEELNVLKGKNEKTQKKQRVATKKVRASAGAEHVGNKRAPGRVRPQLEKS